VVLLGIVPIALYFVIFELIAARLGRCMPNPWLAGLVQAAFTGFTFASIFPFEG